MNPWPVEADLAEVAEKMGQREEAVNLLDQAYRESQGAATRFQWGALYVSGLMRMTPKDSARIQQAGTAVLSELEGPDRIYRRARMQEICVKIPETEPARGSCDAFLKAA